MLDQVFGSVIMEILHSILSDNSHGVVTMLVQYGLDDIFEIIEPLLLDTDKYKQRAGAEVWAGLVRGECCC